MQFNLCLRPMDKLGVFTALLFVFGLTLQSAEGLKCYACTMSVDDSDRNCETDPEHVTTSSPTVKCSKKFCYIKRVEYQDPKGVVFSFLRGCVDRLDLADGEYVDEQFITYIRSCTTSLCNIGDGKKPIGGGMDPQAAGKIHGTIYAPGVGGSNKSAQLPPRWVLLGSLLMSIFTFILYPNWN